MGIYGETAVAVVTVFDNFNKPDPKECWEYSITHFTGSKESQKKGCPKSAFLGLCQDGYVKGIPKGNYLPPDSPNKAYAVVAAERLLSEPAKKYSKSDLWKKATEHFDEAAKNQNGQMDVVLALKDAGLLQKPD
ncbi:hypothetical protein F9U39_01355 [Pectobacterium versatile]|uniref:DUF6979 family protein n=1 Tax=Pectobacterium TaxID=122277 RepID=UPI0015DF7DEA|nr:MULTISPECIES: hypothetical protein [Pectobacterium]MBA0188277.1 hypothetical protein [Pectobacterium odoriferum]MBQ4788060.1 hypothetical protein [Pectobacterium versatile]